MCLPGIWMSSWIWCEAWNSAVKELKGWPWKVCRQNHVSRPASRLSRYGWITTLFIHFDLSGMHARVLTKDLSSLHLLLLYPSCVSTPPALCSLPPSPQSFPRAGSLLMSQLNYTALLVALRKTLIITVFFFFFFLQGSAMPIRINVIMEHGVCHACHTPLSLPSPSFSPPARSIWGVGSGGERGWWGVLSIRGLWSSQCGTSNSIKGIIYVPLPITEQHGDS